MQIIRVYIQNFTELLLNIDKFVLCKDQLIA